GDDHTRVASVLDLLGSVLLSNGEPDRAELRFRQALDIRRRRLGEDHVQVARTQSRLAAALLAREATPEVLDTAAILLDRAFETLSRETPEHDWRRADVESLLGALWLAEGRPDRAEPCLRDGYERLRAVRGEHAVQTRDARQRLDVLTGRQP
ncbi:MAG: tetratricopeptide repeat protein, partial [Acidobacteriota bacterium]